MANIPDLILADDPYYLDKYELVSRYGIEMISSVRCHVLRNHDKAIFEDFDDEGGSGADDVFTAQRVAFSLPLSSVRPMLEALHKQFKKIVPQNQQ